MFPFTRAQKRAILILAAFLFTASFAGAVAAQSRPKLKISAARKSVVLIKRITPGLEPAMGSGFLVSKDGLIYTNRHVAFPADENAKGSILLVGVPSAKDPDVLEYYKAEIAYAPAAQDNLDFAALKIAGKPGAPDFKPLPLAAAKLELGSDVAVLGYPYVADEQPNLSYNKGSISATKVVLMTAPIIRRTPRSIRATPAGRCSMLTAKSRALSR